MWLGTTVALGSEVRLARGSCGARDRCLGEGMLLTCSDGREQCARPESRCQFKGRTVDEALALRGERLRGEGITIFVLMTRLSGVVEAWEPPQWISHE